MSFLRIDGQCRYWTFLGTSPLDEVRSGVLTNARAKQIESDLRYAEWPDIGGTFGGGTVFDAAPDVLSDGRNEITCVAMCSFGGPAEMMALFAKVSALMDDLNTSGQPLSGPVRIALQERQTNASDFLYSTVNWPIASPVTAFLLPFGIAQPGSSFLITDADGETLRSVRMSQRSSTAFRNGVTRGIKELSATMGNAISCVPELDDEE
jgi:hypothetical protein